MLNIEKIKEYTYEQLTDEETISELWANRDPVEFAKYENALNDRAQELGKVKPFRNILKAYEKAVKTAEQRTGTYPKWFYSGVVNEIEFCEEYIQKHNIRCINGRFYGLDGVISDDSIRSDICDSISAFVTAQVAKLTDSLFKTMQNMAHDKIPTPDEINIHTKNGTLCVDNTFTHEKEFCINRLNVNIKEDYSEPIKWLTFLGDLLEDEDILTLQEFLGYCLLPTNRAQKMLFLIGNGGEGKSVIGKVMKSILKDAAVIGSIKDVAENPFSFAMLENKLLLIDDDLTTEALKETAVLKKLVTSEGVMMLNAKHKALKEGYIYARVLAFGNIPLRSLYDNTDGFFRRNIVIRVKDKQENRKDNVMLIDELIEEKEDIFRWAFTGLRRLIAKQFTFTISERTKQYMQEIKEDACNIIAFLNDESTVTFSRESEISSKELYEIYCDWCEGNGYDPFKQRSFMSYLKDNEKKLKIEYSNHVGRIGTTVGVRGFKGIKAVVVPAKFYPY